MATSGTAVYDPPIGEIIEEAYERAGIEIRTGYELVTARRSLNFLAAEWANRGINMWTLEPGTVNLVAGTETYTLPADTVDLVDAAIRTNAGNATTQNDLTITRMSFDTYQALPNKLSQGRPVQYLVRRLAAGPTVTLWLVPDGSQSYQLYYWRMRRIQDAGNNSALTYDIPFRFLPALTSGLAYHLASKRRESMDLVPMLKKRYDEDWLLASQEDRERATLRIVPRRSGSRW